MVCGSLPQQGAITPGRYGNLMDLSGASTKPVLSLSKGTARPLPENQRKEKGNVMTISENSLYKHARRSVGSVLLDLSEATDRFEPEWDTRDA